MLLFVYFGFCFFFPPFFPSLNIFFEMIFKETGMPHCVQQQGWVGTGCPQDSWSWSVGACQYSLASQRIRQISGPGFGATPREDWSWRYWGPGAPCCPEGILEPHSFVLGAASLLPTRSPLHPALLLALHPKPHFPPSTERQRSLGRCCCISRQPTARGQGLREHPHRDGRGSDHSWSSPSPAVVAPLLCSLHNLFLGTFSNVPHNCLQQRIFIQWVCGIT